MITRIEAYNYPCSHESGVALAGFHALAGPPGTDPKPAGAPAPGPTGGPTSADAPAHAQQTES